MSISRTLVWRKGFVRGGFGNDRGVSLALALVFGVFMYLLIADLSKEFIEIECFGPP